MQYYVTALQEGLLYGILAIGIFISLRILNIPDLTAEGSFGIGCAAAAVSASSGLGLLSLPIAMLAGALAGLVTALLQTKLRVHPVISGIITMSAAYSVKLIIMKNTTNVAMGDASFFKVLRTLLANSNAMTKKLAACGVSFLIATAIVLLVIWFFSTHTGMCIRATGDNPEMVSASSINADMEKVIGLCVSNALIGLAGGLVAHYNGYSDVSSSNGILVYGLAAVIIGEAVIGKRGVTIGIISAVIGSVIYKLIVAVVIDFNLFGVYSANLMKLMCAVIVAITLSIPEIKKLIAKRKLLKEAKRNA